MKLEIKKEFFEATNVYRYCVYRDDVFVYLYTELEDAKQLVERIKTGILPEIIYSEVV